MNSNVSFDLQLRSSPPGVLGSQYPTKNIEFFSDLRSYVDSFFWESNQAFCRKYNLDKTYFKPLNSFSKQAILDMIADEEQIRSSSKSTVIENYRILSARITELCIRLAGSKGKVNFRSA